MGPSAQDHSRYGWRSSAAARTHKSLSTSYVSAMKCLLRATDKLGMSCRSASYKTNPQKEDIYLCHVGIGGCNNFIACVIPRREGLSMNSDNLIVRNLIVNARVIHFLRNKWTVCWEGWELYISEYLRRAWIYEEKCFSFWTKSLISRRTGQSMGWIPRFWWSTLFSTDSPEEPSQLTTETCKWRWDWFNEAWEKLQKKVLNLERVWDITCHRDSIWA